MESHYPVSVTPLEDYKLSLTFDNDEKRIFDVKPYLEDHYSKVWFNTPGLAPARITI
jgi:hypothetical protein